MPGYAAAPMAKPPRPQVKTGVTIAVLGSVLMIVGSFLSWFSIDSGFGESESITGFTKLAGESKDGPAFVFLGVVVGGLAIAMFFAGRVLAVAIVAVVFASFAVLAVIVDLSDVSDLITLFDGSISWGPGLWVILVGAGMGLSGSIAALAKRRR